MKRIVPQDIRETDGLFYWRVRTLSAILLFGVVFGLLVFISVIPMAVEEKLWGLLFWDGLIWVAGICLLFMTQISYMIRAAFSVLTVYAIGLAIILSVGPLSGGPVWLFCFAVFAGVLIGPKAAVMAVLTNTATLAVMGYLVVNQKWGLAFPFFKSLKLMYVAGVNFLFLNALAAVSVSALLTGLTRSHEKEKRLAQSLMEEQVKLEAEIKERQLAETALRESEEKYRNILENIEDGYYEVDLHGNYTFFNDSMCRILKYSRVELMGKNNREYMDRENAGKIFKVFNTVFQTGMPTKALDWRLIRKDGSECFVETVVSLIRDANGNGTGFRGIARDVTDRKQLEKQLQQARKMESIGTLAGGIAHDFNNILYIIVGNTELAIQDMHNGRSVFTRLEMIKSSCLRAADIVKQLLNFSRETEQKLRPIDAIALIKKDLQFLRSTIPATIDIRQNLPDAQIFILADPTQINQVLMNLSTNASQAMDQTGGILEINAEKVVLDDEAVRMYPGLMPGDHLKITICDTGPGIAPEHMDKIFDPYFTTKEFGKGSGMGLSVVHGIVKHHMGNISIKSRTGKGAMFCILFPVTDTAPDFETALTEELSFGTGKILFVDDEKAIADTAQNMLKLLGYTVATSLNPADALAVFASDPDAFDLVITDMTMPQMNGAKLAEKMMEIRSDIPVIICTGYSALMDEKKAEDLGIAAYVMKPVSMGVLAGTVQKVLDNQKIISEEH